MHQNDLGCPSVRKISFLKICVSEVTLAGTGYTAGGHRLTCEIQNTTGFAWHVRPYRGLALVAHLQGGYET